MPEDRDMRQRRQHTASARAVRTKRIVDACVNRIGKRQRVEHSPQVRCRRDAMSRSMPRIRHMSDGTNAGATF